uniref:Uncharacterized protein n=1 Tax=Knipowitschia caucasica TaxID=637954 RepID=A0AAV2JP77_KNICA
MLCIPSLPCLAPPLSSWTQSDLTSAPGKRLKVKCLLFRTINQDSSITPASGRIVREVQHPAVEETVIRVSASLIIITVSASLIITVSASLIIITVSASLIITVSASLIIITVSASLIIITVSASLIITVPQASAKKDLLDLGTFWT